MNLYKIPLMMFALLISVASQAEHSIDENVEAILTRSFETGNTRMSKEIRLIKLLDKAVFANDKATVYQALAAIYAGSGLDDLLPRYNQIERIEIYSELALQYTSNALWRCKLYGYLYSSKKALYFSSENVASKEAREEIVKPALRGFKCAAEHIETNSKKDRIKGFVYNGNGDTNSVFYQKNIEEMNALLAQQAVIISQNKLHEYKRTFMEWIVSLYIAPQVDVNELNLIALDILGDSPAYEKIMKAVLHKRNEGTKMSLD